ncbi:MAG: Crp/Fnr family transcriptional regulator [Thermodesulforhabdaceae bacterium]|jgi:CRP-like cAMP-binding protein
MIYSEDFEKLLITTCSCGLDEKVSLLRRVPAFGSVPIDQLKILASLCPCRTYQPGQFVFYQGNYDTNGYILKSGRVRMIRHYKDRSFIVKELELDEFFGGLALLADIKRLFSAQAVDLSNCLVVPRDVFKRFVVQFPEVSLRMLEIMVKRIASMEDRFMELYVEELKGEMLY